MWQRLLQIKTQLLAHEGFRRYGANTAWLMGEKILRMFIGLFVGIWIARYLGPEQFGLLSYAQSFVFLFTAVATLGLDSIVVRELVRDQSQRDILLGTAFTLKFAGSIVILPLLWVGVQFTSNDNYTNLLIFIIASATIFQSFNVIDFYYQSTVMSKYVAFSNTITLAISSLVKIYLILSQASLLAFAFVGVFDALILALGMIYFYLIKTKYSLRQWKFNSKLAKRLLQDSFPLLIGGICFVTFSNVDVIMLKHYTSDIEVGLYAAAYRISSLWYFLPGLVLSSLVPAIIKVKTDTKQYEKRTILLTTLLVWLAIIIALVITIFPDRVLSLTYGDDYLKSIESLIILIWVNVFIFFNSAWNYWKIIEGKERLILYFHSLVAILNILMNLYLIPKFGSYGAALSIIISLILVLMLFFIIDSKTKNLILSILLLRFLRYV